MNGFDIVMVIAIILFARLGVRLVTGYIRMKKENKEKIQGLSEDILNKDLNIARIVSLCS